MATVLTVLPEGFEEIEAITPIDLWRRAGFSVTTAALGLGIHVTGRSSITLHADTTLDQVPLTAEFDLIFLPGGPGVSRLRASETVMTLLKTQHQRGARIAAICAAPLVLHDAGLLAGRRYTAHFSTEHELSSILADEPVVIDGPIITSRGAGTSLQFALKVIAELTDPASARKIEVSICADFASS